MADQHHREALCRQNPLRRRDVGAQRSVRLDVERLETLCSRMVNHPLDRPLRFELRPFPNQLEKAWSHAVNLAMACDDMNIALPSAAAASFDEFLTSLVLTQHAHDYTEELHGRMRSAPSRLIREAEHMMRTGDTGLTVSEVASRLRVSLRSLEAGFQECRRMTPTQRLREIRLLRVRERLLAATDSTSVTSVALENGFFHLPRFSGHYRAAFGESPGVTLRRTRRIPFQSARLQMSPFPDADSRPQAQVHRTSRVSLPSEHGRVWDFRGKRLYSDT